jgi:hypothetical protein
MTTTTAPKTDAPKLTETEKKLLQQIQAQSKPQLSLVKFLSRTTCGFYY